jgi:hypothetical protein
MTGVVLKHALSERGDDLYETPPGAVKALLRHERLPHRLWDPCCGPGNIVNVLRAAGHEVIGSDLVDYGDPTHFYRRDFLMERKGPGWLRRRRDERAFQVGRGIHRPRARCLSAGDRVGAARLHGERAPHRDPRRPWTRAYPRLPPETPDDAPPRLGGPKSKLGDGVRLVRLGSQPYGADDDRSDLLGATMTRRNQPEAQLQRSLIEHLQWCARGDVWWTHIPNGGWRSPTEAAIFKLLGVRAGSPDLQIAGNLGEVKWLKLRSKSRLWQECTPRRP